MEPSEKVIQQLPSKELLQNYGRKSKLLKAIKDIPNLQFNIEETGDTSKFGEHSQKLPEDVEEVVEVIETKVILQKECGRCMGRLQVSEDCEHLRNSLSNAAGAALLCTFQDNLTKITSDTETQGDNCENYEHSRKLLISAAGVALQLVTVGEATRKMSNVGQQERPSESSECLRKLWGDAVSIVYGPTDEVAALRDNKPMQMKASEYSKN